LADYVIGPWEIEAELSRGKHVVALDGGSSVNSALPRPISGAALRHRYVAGFLSDRANNAGAFLSNTVLVFPDSGAATAAARELSELAANDPTLSVAPPIATHPDVATHIWKGSDCGCGAPPKDSLLAFRAHRQYILVQNAASSDGIAPAADLIAKTIDLQANLIDEFTPTPANQLAALRVDPTGLLARTVPISAADSSTTVRAVYGPRGTLHFQSDPIRSGDMFHRAGLVRSAFAAAQVYETQTDRGAQEIAQDFYADASRDGVPLGGVDRLPGSSCVASGIPYGGGGVVGSVGGPGEAFYCVTQVGKYAIVVSGQETDAKQLLAAQYLLLKPS
jgi:hypothetical protein